MSMTASDEPALSLAEKIDIAIKDLGLLRLILQASYPNEQRLEQYQRPPSIWEEILTALEDLPYAEGETNAKDDAVTATRCLIARLTECAQLIGQLFSRYSWSVLLEARKACQKAVDQADLLKQAAAKISAIKQTATHESTAQPAQDAAAEIIGQPPTPAPEHPQPIGEADGKNQTVDVLTSAKDEPHSLELTGPRLNKLRDALISAFPTVQSLHGMVRYHMDKNPEIVAAGQNLESAVDNLLRWGKAQSCLREIVLKARIANPGNADLLSFARSVGLE